MGEILRVVQLQALVPPAPVVADASVTLEQQDVSNAHPLEASRQGEAGLPGAHDDAVEHPRRPGQHLARHGPLRLSVGWHGHAGTPGTLGAPRPLGADWRGGRPLGHGSHAGREHPLGEREERGHGAVVSQMDVATAFEGSGDEGEVAIPLECRGVHRWSRAAREGWRCRNQRVLLPELRPHELGQVIRTEAIDRHQRAVKSHQISPEGVRSKGRRLERGVEEPTQGDRGGRGNGVGHGRWREAAGAEEAARRRASL